MLSCDGGSLLSYKLKGQNDGEGLVDLVLPNGEGNAGLRTVLENADSIDSSGSMSYRMIDDTTIEFSGRYASMEGDEQSEFTYKKTYSFKNGEYLFALRMEIEDENSGVASGQGPVLRYRLVFGPQIGPSYVRLDNASGSEYRKFTSYASSKKKDIEVSPGKPRVLESRVDWVALVGKYFLFIELPDRDCREIRIISGKDHVIDRSGSIALSGFVSRSHPETHAFYFGPKTSAELSKYSYSDKNAFGLSGQSFDSAIDQSDILGWLESLLKDCLRVFHGLVPNYGIDIILLTILVKVCLLPLAVRAAASSARMQAIQPRLTEMQEKYGSNPSKLNQKMAELYRDEEINPLSSFLPLLAPVPIFIALYNIFNNCFDLRGALFIDGWITDLSRPDSIVDIAPINLGFLQISALRGLPLIYLASQAIYSKYGQGYSPTSNASRMRLVVYGVPIIFFFVLYDVPSGLVTYWIASNLLSLIQQVVINRFYLRGAGLSRGEAKSSGKRDIARHG